MQEEERRQFLHSIGHFPATRETSVKKEKEEAYPKLELGLPGVLASNHGCDRLQKLKDETGYASDTCGGGRDDFNFKHAH